MRRSQVVSKALTSSLGFQRELERVNGGAGERKESGGRERETRQINMVITCHARNRNIQLGLGKLTRESSVPRVASSEPSRHAGQMPQWWQFSLFSPTFVTLVGNDLVHFCSEQLQNNKTAHKTLNTLGHFSWHQTYLWLQSSGRVLQSNHALIWHLAYVKQFLEHDSLRMMR